MSIIWSEALRMTIPGQPVPKGRPRFTTRGGKPRTFTDAKTVQYEHRVAWLISNATRSRELAPAGVPVRVDILAIFPRPKRLMRKKDPAGLMAHPVRPDLDNVAKALLDSVTAAGVWADDGQVTCIRAEAAYCEKDQEPRVEMSIYLPAEEAPQGKTLIEVFDALETG